MTYYKAVSSPASIERVPMFVKDGFSFDFNVFTNHDEVFEFGIPKSHTKTNPTRQAITIKLTFEMLRKYTDKLAIPSSLLHMLALEYCKVASQATVSVYYRVFIHDGYARIILCANKFPDEFLKNIKEQQNDLLTATLNVLGHLLMLDVEKNAKDAYLLAQDVYNVKLANERIFNQMPELKKSFKELFSVCSDRTLRVIAEKTCDTFHYLNNVTAFYHVAMLAEYYNQTARSENGNAVVDAWMGTFRNLLCVPSDKLE